jgi:hypothetical protein
LRGSEKENLIFFYNFIRIFGVEVSLHGKKYPLLVGVQYVLTKPSDFTEADTQTKAVQSILEDSRDLGLLFRRWTSKALERFIEQHEAGGSSAASTIEGMPSFFAEGTQPTLPTLPDEHQRPVSAADLACRVRILMATIEHVERMAGAAKDNALADDRLAQVQFDELVDLRKETCSLFRADIEQFVAWYTVPTAWRGSPTSSDEFPDKAG